MERGGYGTKKGIGEREREETQKTHSVRSIRLFVLTSYLVSTNL